MPIEWPRSECRREVCTSCSQLRRVSRPYCPAAVLAPLNPSSRGWRAVVSPNSICVSFQKNMAPYVGNLESNTLFCYFPAPAEVVNMLKDVCVDGFYFVGVVLDASSIFFGMGTGCFVHLFILLSWQIGGGVTEIIPWFTVSFVCVNPACADRSPVGAMVGMALGRYWWLVGWGRNIVVWVCDEAKWIVWSPEHVLGPKENRFNWRSAVP